MAENEQEPQLPGADDPQPDPEVAVPVAQGLPTVVDALEELDQTPARTSVLSEAGYVVRP